MANNLGGDVSPVAAEAVSPLGQLLRGWRRRRRMSQLDLASDADISARHLSFIETGRARPSRPMLLHLSGRLDIPLRERNALLAAAGFPPVFRERRLTDPALGLMRLNIETTLDAFDPHPALACDRHWTMVAANRAFSRLVAGAEPALLRPPVNLLRVMLHPAGLAPRIINLAQWRGEIMNRLRRQIDLNGDPALRDLLDEVWDYPCPRRGTEADAKDALAIPLRLASIEGELAFFSTFTHFAMPLDITLSELVIEAFLPADARTAEVLRHERNHQEPVFPEPLPAELV